MTRPDLLALDTETLAALTSRGLVKRAARDLAAGAGATVTAGPDTTLTARYPDGATAALAPGAGLDRGTCTCAATTLCRHLVGLVLAHQQASARPPGPDPAVPPAPTDAAEGPEPPGPAAPPTPSASAPPGPPAEPVGNAGGPEAAVPATGPETGAPGAPAGAAAPAAASAPSDVGRPGAAGPGGECGTRPGAVPEPVAGAAGGAEWLPWSPGDTDDEALVAAVGARAVAAARRTLARGYTARLTHPRAGAPAARAELPTCTVRFPVRGAVAHAVTDAADAVRGEAVALAVWAFRAAVGADPERPPSRVDVGGADSAREAAAGLDRSGPLLADLLLDGAAHAGPVLPGALGRARDELAAGALHWQAGVLAGVLDQLVAYRERGAGFRAEELAALLGEADGRARTRGLPGAALGGGERGDTPLRRVRLTALGCRISGTAADRTAEVYLAHGGAGIALVLRRSWAVAEGPAATGPALARRRIAGSTLGALAAANVVSEVASRTPGRTVKLGTSRVAATGVTPVGNAWDELPEPLLVRDFAAHARALRRRPPRFARARVEAEAVHVLAVDGVEEIGYDPARQELRATLRDARGATARLVAPYNPYSPGGLDVLAAALRGGDGGDGGGTPGVPGSRGPGPVRSVSGFVRVTGEGLVVEPLAVRTADGTVVPDLAPAPRRTAALPHAAPAAPGDPVGLALEGALSALATVAVHGLRRLPAGAAAALADAAGALARRGLTTTAEQLRRVPAALAGEGPEAAVRPWLDAQLRLLTAVELHARGD
ncbi:hypothetical protein [Streptomyces omiyaensis]|uniref:hypothetical protein n=1 Tax=Streptomyces omiyaensis TaxID=68247 RepID=UPI003701B49B